MGDAHRVPGAEEVVPQPLGDVDGSVPSPGAPDPDRQVGAVLLPIVRQAPEKEVDQTAVERLGRIARLDIPSDLGVAAGPGPKDGVEVRVREEADVEAEVERRRKAVLETEGADREGGESRAS